MQKFSINSLTRVAIRGAIFGLSALLVFCVGIGALYAVANSSSGGKFGEILNRILANGNWENSNGTVKNAEKLGGLDVSKFQQIGNNKTCGENQCIYWFDANGNVMCR